MDGGVAAPHCLRIGPHYSDAGLYDGARVVRASIVAFGLLALVLLPPFAAAQKKRAEVADASGAGRVFRDCPACPEMVVLPAGEFIMGSPESEKGRNKDEGPQRKVVLAQPFAVGKFEVTFAQWDACVAEGGCAHKPGDETWGRGRRPVINVSWDDAKQFVGWLAKKTGKPYRLLTEAEWEYAARGVTKALGAHAPFSTGATINYKQANYDANFRYGNGNRASIGRRRWTWDHCRATPSASTTCTATSGSGSRTVTRTAMPARRRTARPSRRAACTLRILRGGSWNYYPQLLRSAYRYATAGGIRVENTGFRVARAL